MGNRGICLGIVYNGGDEPSGTPTRVSYYNGYIVIKCLANLGFWTTRRTHEVTSTLRQGMVEETYATWYSPATQITVIKLHNRELGNFFSSPDIIRAIKSKMMK
jgi:hypothetical protein